MVIVPGPGPSEPQLHNPQSSPATHTMAPEMKLAPPTPSDPAVDGPDTNTASSDHDETNDGPTGSSDPYSNLDGAFGNYLADEPRPMAAGSHRVRHDEEDDLLF